MTSYIDAVVVFRRHRVFAYAWTLGRELQSWISMVVNDWSKEGPLCFVLFFFHNSTHTHNVATAWHRQANYQSVSTNGEHKSSSKNEYHPVPLCVFSTTIQASRLTYLITKLQSTPPHCLWHFRHKIEPLPTPCPCIAIIISKEEQLVWAEVAGTLKSWCTAFSALTLLVGRQEGRLACKKWGDGGGGYWLVRMEWRPARWSVCLPLLIFPRTLKFRSSLLAPARPGGPGKRAVKRLWCGVVALAGCSTTDTVDSWCLSSLLGICYRTHHQCVSFAV